MTESAFHDEVLRAFTDQAKAMGEIKTEVAEGLGGLKAELVANTVGLQAIVDRQDITNGRIADQERKTGDMQVELAERRNNCPLAAHAEENLLEHIKQCPMQGRVTILEQYVNDAKATEKANTHWMSKLWPLIYAAAGIAFYMMLTNADNILEAIRLKHHIG